MNTDQIEGDWNRIKGDVKMRWGKLTDDEVTIIAGRKDKLLGKLQARYGYAKARAEKELSEFTEGLKKTAARVAKSQESKPVLKASTAKKK